MFQPSGAQEGRSVCVCVGVAAPSPPAAMLLEAGVVNPKMVDWKQQLLYGEEMRWSPWSYTEGRKGERVSHHGLKGL